MWTFFKSSAFILLAVALAKLVLHLLTSAGYGFFRDELYYIACSEHLDWGYVDHPPLSIALLWAARKLLGDSLFAIRLLPAIAGALTVYLVGLMTRALGGKRFAMGLAMTAAMAAPEYLGLYHIYSMNAFDVMIWALAAYLVIRIVKEQDSRLWIVLGLVLGLGLENKISILWLGAGLLAGLLLTPDRKWLARPWPWLSGGCALALFAPHLLWQAANGWPTLEFIENATTQKMASVSVLDFWVGQILTMHPLNLPLWLGGLVFLLFSKRARPFRLLGWIYAAVAVLLVSAGTSRAGYLAPAYTWLLAGGAVFFEGATAGAKTKAKAWIRAGSLGLLILGGLTTAPLALPLLSVKSYIQYAKAIGVEPATEEKKEIGALPQHYADMHGWREIVETVARAYEKLTPKEKKRVAILAPNYGVAGAIDFFGPAHGLPGAISRHNNYWLWGPGQADGKVILVLGASKEDLSRRCKSHELLAVIECGYCMPYENHRPVHVCRDLNIPMARLWAESKNFN